MPKTALLTSVDENVKLAFHFLEGTFDGDRRLDVKFDRAFHGRDFVDRNLCTVCRGQRAKCRQFDSHKVWNSIEEHSSSVVPGARVARNATNRDLTQIRDINFAPV